MATTGERARSFSSSSSDRILRIGGVESEVGAFGSKNEGTGEGGWRIPRGATAAVGGREVVQSDAILLSHLRWMMQKDALGQDMFLLGPPGPWRRRLLMLYAELSGREVEWLCVTRDTTESDLKQRREIVAGDDGKSAVFVDQAPVRAALNGRLLILDGIEKAERNVLPTLNNLLENREMQLEDGRFLMSHARYDELSSDDSTRSRLVRTHEDFRVAALAVPIPQYRGKPLDPPLRSRFQARRIDPPSASTQFVVLKNIAPSVPDATIRGGIDFMEGLHMIEGGARDASSSGGKILHFPDMALAPFCAALEHFPLEDPSALLARSYPFVASAEAGIPLTVDQEHMRRTARLAIAETSLGEAPLPSQRASAYSLASVDPHPEMPNMGTFSFRAPDGST